MPGEIGCCEVILCCNQELAAELFVYLLVEGDPKYCTSYTSFSSSETAMFLPVFEKC